MRDNNSKKSKLSWSKTLVKKWFNIKSKAEDFHADNIIDYIGVDDEWRNNFSEKEAWVMKKSKTGRSNKKNSDRLRRSKIDVESANVTDVHNYKIFVGTWNVAGKPPPSYLGLEELHTSPPADIYVLGFQEIVPLNAGNVLGTEDNGPARKWLALIRKTLNNLPGTYVDCQTPSPVPDPIVELDADFEGSATTEKASSFFHRRSFQSLSRSLRTTDNDISAMQPRLDRRFSVCDRVIFGGHRPSDYYDDPNLRSGSSDDENDSPEFSHHSPLDYNGSFSMEERQNGNSRYCLVASKQMVGIFLTVWVKSDLRDSVRNMKVSCVGRGLMGYLGNKGSISISMSLHQTSFCFICSHLTSGQKEGDELRRNSDVMEILRKTRFPRVHGVGDEYSPQTILEHDRVIWLGDLNYRIALSYRSAKALVEMRNWRALLENDQLQIEQRRGRVFQGWNEGKIYFPPTYKYSNNSDRYAGDDDQRRHPKEKRRTPAWCDRILWYGRGLTQLSYVRGEARFSDHRPVYSIFLAEVESVNRTRIKKSMSCSSSRIEVEELLPQPHRYNELNFY
ncbi:type I inositol polyphosphate 5-phosphatase 4 [Rutidosis leptorrhynchoides]|uniref:type I inositol polyphosphate 5-phosphatase 4 n=1 Tax=Rutidosis leptorrhynchoides TaxID=125765 RepID=UPI003A99079D